MVSRLAFSSIFLIGLCGAALADRIITVPKGTKLRNDTLKVEGYFQRGATSRYWLDRSVGENWEFGLNQIGDRLTLNAAYNYLLPLTDIAPGITFGVQDVLGVSPERRAVYAAFTFFEGNEGELNQDVPTEFTFGVWSRKGGSTFGGISLPISKQVRMVAEWDSYVIAGGLDFRPFKEGSAKVVFSERGLGMTLSFSHRF